MHRGTSHDTNARSSPRSTSLVPIRSPRSSGPPIRRVLLAALAMVTAAACSSDGTSSPRDRVADSIGDDDGAAIVEGDTPDRPDTPGTTDRPDGGDGDADPGGPSVTGDGSGSSLVTLVENPDRGVRCDRRGTGSGTEITVWTGLGGDQAPAAFDALVDEFEMWNPDITVDAVPVGSPRNALQLLREADPDHFPDLLMGGIDHTRLLAEAGLFVPPGACWDGDPPVLDDLLPIIRSTVTVDGVLWSYPFNVSTPVLLYDRTLLEELDIDPDDGPVTSEELAGGVAALTESGAAPGGLVLYDRSASWLIEQWAARHGHVLVEPDNGRGGHPVDGVDFATDEAVDALDWARRLYADGLVTWVGLNLSGLDDLFRLIDLDDRASFTMHTSAALGDVARLVHDEGVAGPDAEVGVAPLPSPMGGSGTLVGGASLWLVDNLDPVTIGAAARFAEFLMSPTSQATFTVATGYVPATVSAAEHPTTESRWEELPQFQVPYQQLAAQGTSPAEVGMQIGPRVPVQRVLEEAAADVIVNGVDARDRLTRAESEALELIRRYELESESHDD